VLVTKISQELPASIVRVKEEAKIGIRTNIGIRILHSDPLYLSFIPPFEGPLLAFCGSPLFPLLNIGSLKAVHFHIRFALVRVVSLNAPNAVPPSP
jgi:hypothetical protein